ncbi:MAG: polymer-forming cytoskeletal protein, partial [Pseudomonadota bacterium]
ADAGGGAAPAVPSAPPTPPAPLTQPTTAAQGTVGRAAASVIGEGLLIVGNLTSKSEVHIDGEVKGDIRGAQVLIGKSARISGNVIGDDVVVRGHVKGAVHGRRVAVQASGHVEGDIHHETLAIEQGAFFEGRSKRSPDPFAGVGSA